jgi:hypothetical protein
MSFENRISKLFAMGHVSAELSPKFRGLDHKSLIGL